MRMMTYQTARMIRELAEDGVAIAYVDFFTTEKTARSRLHAAARKLGVKIKVRPGAVNHVIGEVVK